MRRIGQWTTVCFCVTLLQQFPAWESDWGWGDEVKEVEDGATGDYGKDDWLHECEVSASSLGDVIIIAREDRIAVLQGKISI